MFKNIFPLHSTSHHEVPMIIPHVVNRFCRFTTECDKRNKVFFVRFLCSIKCYHVQMLSQVASLPTATDQGSSWHQHLVWTVVWSSTKVVCCTNANAMQTIGNQHQDFIFEQNGLHIQKQHVKMHQGMYC